MHSALPVDALVLAGALLILAGVVAASLADRFHAPALLVFLGVGMVVGDDGLGWVRFDDARLAQTVSVIALVVILFDGGLATPPRELRSVAGPAAALALAGTAVTTGVVALGAHALFGIGWTTALLLGAIVGPTDAAAVFGALGRVPLPSRLSSLLEAESGLNDPMAVLLTVAVLESWRSGVTVGGLAVFAAQQLVGGALVGALVGTAGAWLLKRLRSSNASLFPVAALGVGALAYGVATQLAASGFLAVYLAGVVVGHRVARHRRSIRTFHEAAATMAQIGLFLVLGLLVFPGQLPRVAGKAVGITLVLVLVARPAAVLSCLTWFRFRRAELALVSWTGLRGAVPIVLATFPLTAAYPDGPLVFDVVFFVVLLSTLVQGATVAPLARRLGLRADADPG